MELENILPIGTVVLLKQAMKKLMIIGYKPILPDTDTEFDYIGVLYPEGFLGNKSSYLFNCEDINDIIFAGYSNPEYNEFVDLLRDLYDADNNEAEVENE